MRRGKEEQEKETGRARRCTGRVERVAGGVQQARELLHRKWREKGESQDSRGRSAGGKVRGESSRYSVHLSPSAPLGQECQRRSGAEEKGENGRRKVFNLPFFYLI